MTNPIGNTLRSLLLLFLLGMMPFAFADSICNTDKKGGMGGIGGTGKADTTTNCASNTLANGFKGGIGGTGSQAATDGIGGTGIIGVITDFGSIWVNGIRVQYNETTPVHAFGKRVTSDQLALGQVVAVEATSSENSVQARQITVLNVVTGPVGEINLQQNQITILGQAVRVTPETHNVALRDLKIGSHVRISGLRETRGIIVATRIDPAPRDVIEVSGRVDKLVNNGFSIALLSVSATSITGLEVGREVRVSGTWDGQSLHAQQLKVEPILPFNGKFEQLSLQGYVSTVNKSERIRLGAAEIVIPSNLAVPNTDRPNNSNANVHRDTQSETLIHVRVRIDADHRLVAERIDLERHIQDRDHLIKQEINSAKNRENHTEPPLREKHSNPDTGKDAKIEKNNSLEEDRHKHPERPDHTDRAENIRHSELGSGSGRDHPEDD